VIFEQKKARYFHSGPFIWFFTESREHRNKNADLMDDVRASKHI